MIILDFLTLRMPGMLDRMSIQITFQTNGNDLLSLYFGEAIDCYNRGFNPVVATQELPPKIILPGYCSISPSYFVECFKTIQELEKLHQDLGCLFILRHLFFVDLKGNLFELFL